MKNIGAFQAKTHFSEILAEVSAGEEFIVTLRGKKVAKVIPFSEEAKESSPQASIRSIRELRKGLRRGKLNLKKLRAEGRK